MANVPFESQGQVKVIAVFFVFNFIYIVFVMVWLYLKRPNVHT